MNKKCAFINLGRIKYFIFFIFIFEQILASCNEIDYSKIKSPVFKRDVEKEKSDIYKYEIPSLQSSKLNSKKKVLETNNETHSANTVPSKVEPITDDNHIASLTSGALIRSIYVILGLSIFVMVYILCRSFRLGNPKVQVVRKYGIIAHKQDVEMKPLPLDEDDEDDTVFDATNIVLQARQL